MPTPEQNKETVSAFAREVFGNKNLDHARTWLADDFVEHQVFPGTCTASEFDAEAVTCGLAG
jgi:predicted RNA-binding protein with PIN domain